MDGRPAADLRAYLVTAHPDWSDAAIDATLAKFKLDAIVFPTNAPSWPTDHINGDHVAGGAIFMLFIMMRGLGGQFTAKNHEAVEACSLYWHFVDVVWLILFATIYIFGR